MELRDISVTYGDHEAVKAISARAAQARFIALLGPNGSGKSSLIKAIAGVIRHGGEVNFGTGFADRKSRARHVAYLAQQRIGPPLMPIRDVVALGRVPHLGRLSKLTDSDEAAIEVVMAKLNLRRFDGRSFGQLSGGEQARVLLGRALAVQAPILLADEPIASLDPAFQLQILGTLKDAAKSGACVITAMHDLSLAECYADEIWVMSGGELVAQGPAQEALSDQVLRDVFGVRRMSGSRFGQV